jgi:hypothetical protein
MATVRVAVVQMDFFPAMISSSINYLLEPTGEDNGFHRLMQLDEIVEFSDNYQKEYIQLINYKVQTILSYVSKKNTDVVIFPEYSIPVFILPTLNNFSKKNNIIIIAGTHTVTNNNSSTYERAQLGLVFSGPKSDVRKSVCPIFTPTNNFVVRKRHKTKWEQDMILNFESA